VSVFDMHTTHYLLQLSQLKINFCKNKAFQVVVSGQSVNFWRGWEWWACVQ